MNWTVESWCFIRCYLYPRVSSWYNSEHFPMELNPASIARGGERCLFWRGGYVPHRTRSFFRRELLRASPVATELPWSKCCIRGYKRRHWKNGAPEIYYTTEFISLLNWTMLRYAYKVNIGVAVRYCNQSKIVALIANTIDAESLKNVRLRIQQYDWPR